MISLAMIAKNESDRIGQVLDDARGICDELIVVDTGSTDDTVKAAAAHGARVIVHGWADDFAEARNYAFAQCTGEWILWLDADDRLPAESAEILRSLVVAANVDAVFCEYRLYDTGGCLLMRYDRERLIRRVAGLQWAGRVHETIAVPAGRSTRSDAWVEHRPDDKPDSDPDRNSRILQAMVDDGDNSPRTLYYLANEYRDLGRDEEAIRSYENFLDVANTDHERYDALVSVSACYTRVGRIGGLRMPNGRLLRMPGCGGFGRECDIDPETKCCAVCGIEEGGDNS